MAELDRKTEGTTHVYTIITTDVEGEGIEHEYKLVGLNHRQVRMLNAFFDITPGVDSLKHFKRVKVEVVTLEQAKAIEDSMYGEHADYNVLDMLDYKKEDSD